MPRFLSAGLALLMLAVCAMAQPTVPLPAPAGPGLMGPTEQTIDSAVAARCQVTQARHVGLIQLVRMACNENKLSMEVWLGPREIATWLAKDVAISVVPIMMAPDVRVSPGRAPRSDYTRPKPVHVQIIAGPHEKVVATLVSLIFH